MKRGIFRLITLFLIFAVMLTGCGPIVEDVPESLSLYATFYPIYALTALITDGVPDLELHCLVQPQDGCLRDYTLSDWDLYMIAYSADGILAGGSGLESFESTLVSISEAGPALAEVMYGLEMHESTGEYEEGSHFDGSNPHLYMSVDGAMHIVENISGSLSVMDARYAGQYQENLSGALQQLSALKDELQAKLAPYAGQSVAIMNEALVYIAEDYGLEIATVVERESSSHLYGAALDEHIEQMRENGVQVVLIEQQAPKILVDDLEAAGFSIAKIDILSTHRESDGSQGYFDAQRANAEAIAGAFKRISDS